MRTENKTWMFVGVAIGAVALGLGVIALADYLRPSKMADRQLYKQLHAEENKKAPVKEAVPE